jgi:glycosyltransferase involved in cell wall biosynthesis
MRSLAILRPNARTHPGGDVVHVEHAAEALRELGIEVDVVSTDSPDARAYDVAHVFGIFEPETAGRQIAAIRRTRTPLVLSPIWLDLRALFTLGPQVEKALSARASSDVERRLARLHRIKRRLLWHGGAARAAERRLRAQRELMLAADVLLPASDTEAYLYAERLEVGGKPFVVAPLGVEADAFAVQRGEPRADILCAGRIEPKKNQAALLYALRNLDVEVSLVGRAADASYLALCKRWATPRTHFVDHVGRTDLLQMMARAAVHAHPSWLETPGLSSLEAAAGGAQIVVGELGCEREYFGTDAHYAHPADPARIRAAVEAALARHAREPGDALERRLRAFTWRRHAEATLDAYARAIASVR